VKADTELVSGVKSQVVQSLSLFLVNGVVWIVLSALFLELDSLVDEVESGLDLGRDWRWSGQMISMNAEAVLISLVLNVDNLTVWAFVAVRSLLNESARWIVFTDVLEVAALLGQDVVSSFVTKNHNVITKVQPALSISALTVSYSFRRPSGPWRTRLLESMWTSHDRLRLVTLVTAAVASVAVDCELLGAMSAARSHRNPEAGR
jgi:hypothetical protein